MNNNKQHYDNETIKWVRESDMVDFFIRCKGFTFKRQGADYRCCEHDSLVVKSDMKSTYVQ